MPGNLEDSWSFAAQIDIPALLMCDLCLQETVDNARDESWSCSDGRKDRGGEFYGYGKISRRPRQTQLDFSPKLDTCARPAPDSIERI